MDNKYTAGIDKFINDNRENIVRDILGLRYAVSWGSRPSTARIRSATVRSATQRIISPPSRTSTSSPSARAGRATRSRCASARDILSAAV